MNPLPQVDYHKPVAGLFIGETLLNESKVVKCGKLDPCCCMPAFRDEGLMLVSDSMGDEGKFRRLGMILIYDNKHFEGSPMVDLESV